MFVQWTKKKHIKMKLIPHHLRRLPNVLENPNIPLSPHNPQQRKTHDPPKSLASKRISKHLKEITIISQILLGWTHSILAYEKILCHNLKVIGQCKKRWSIVSLLLLQRMHQSRLRALKGLFTCNMSLVFTFLCATNQTKTP